jgi:hypothetical protein
MNNPVAFADVERAWRGLDAAEPAHAVLVTIARTSLTGRFLRKVTRRGDLGRPPLLLLNYRDVEALKSAPGD